MGSDQLEAMASPVVYDLDDLVAIVDKDVDVKVDMSLAWLCKAVEHIQAHLVEPLDEQDDEESVDESFLRCFGLLASEVSTLFMMQFFQNSDPLLQN